MGPAAYPFNPAESINSYPNRVLIEPDPVTQIRDIDFDAMEILNGTHNYSPTRRRALLTDWFALLNQGINISGTANSDSHNKSQQVALPRNMVAITNDSILGFSQTDFVSAIHKGDMYGTTGPLLQLQLGQAGMGDTYRGASGTLQGQALSAPWVAAEELRVRVNGKVVHRQSLGGDGAFSVPLKFSQDSHVIIEVEGAPGPEYQRLYPGQRPYAFSNPIFVDADNDMAWQPPGLAQDVLPTLP